MQMEATQAIREIRKFESQIRKLPTFTAEIGAIEALHLLVQMRLLWSESQHVTYSIDSLEYFPYYFSGWLEEQIPELREPLNKFFDETKRSDNTKSADGGCKFSDLSRRCKNDFIGQVMALSTAIKMIMQTSGMPEELVVEDLAIITKHKLQETSDQEVDELIARIDKKLDEASPTDDGFILKMSPDDKD